MQQLCHGSAFSNQFHIIETIELHRMNDETLFLKTVSATICRGGGTVFHHDISWPIGF